MMAAAVVRSVTEPHDRRDRPGILFGTNMPSPDIIDSEMRSKVVFTPKSANLSGSSARSLEKL